MGRPKINSTTTEERKKRKRELERKRYQKIKGDPVLYAQYQQNNKAKYEKRKAEKKVVSINEMTPKAKRAQRKKWRDAFNAHYKRKKEAKAATMRFVEVNSPPDSEAEENNVHRIDRDSTSPSILAPIPMLPIFSGNKENDDPNSRVIRSQCSPLLDCRLNSRVSEISSVSSRGNSPCQSIRRLRYKKEKEIKELTRQLEGVKKVNECYRKKLKKLTDEKTEGSVDSMNDKLLESFAALKTHKAKQEFSSNLQANIKTTLKDKGRLGKLSNIFRRRVSNQKGSKVKKIREDIKRFLEEDENSSITAGKKETIKKAGIIKQKRYMTNSLYNLHQKFVTKVDYKLSFSTFSRFRPFWVLFPSQKPKETCLCVTHENFSLLVEAMHKSHIIPHKNVTDVLKDICCDPYNPKCLLRICNDCKAKVITNFQEFDNSVNFSYWSWASKRELLIQNGREKFIRVVKKEKIVTRPKEAIQIFENQLENFSQHCGKVTTQHNAINTLKNNLQPDEAIIHVDFSENYKCQYAKEIQAVHFGGSRKQITLHTSVLYFVDSSNTRTTQSFATISQNLRHDAAAVWAHVVPILEYLEQKAPEISTLHFVSDSATSQYRNFKTFFVIGALKWHIPRLISLTWNYTESGHGKGAPDGVGGTLKRTADAIVSRGNDIPDFDTLIEELKTHVKNIVITTVSDYDIAEKDILLPTDLRSFKGTQKVHQVIWNDSDKYQVTMRNLSCVEKACIIQPRYCSHVKCLGSHVLRPANPDIADEIYNLDQSNITRSVAPLQRSYAFCATSEANLPDELLSEIVTETSNVRPECAELCLSEEMLIHDSLPGLKPSCYSIVKPSTSKCVRTDIIVGAGKSKRNRKSGKKGLKPKKNTKAKGLLALIENKRDKLSTKVQKNSQKGTKKTPKTTNQSQTYEETTSDIENTLPPSPESDNMCIDDEMIDKSDSEENDYCKDADEDNIHEGDWVVVKFISEKNLIHRYVGQVVNESLASLDIKFAKKVNERKFKWPEKPDMSVIGKDQVIKKLPPPYFKSSSKRIGAFEFPKSLRQLKID